jgi:8-oxo-dGTP pyrophosphatase MutT (NUDIX family)
MAELKVGVVDVYVIRPYRAEWLVLALRRAVGTRCPGSWEAVHGRIEGEERPEHAAEREVREETGLAVDRLYSITCQPFYPYRAGVIEMAVVFAAFVREDGDVRLGVEHEAYEWLSMGEAATRFTWPREREALQHIAILLGGGDAGPAEDVLRVI